VPIYANIAIYFEYVTCEMESKIYFTNTHELIKINQLKKMIYQDNAMTDNIEFI